MTLPLPEQFMFAVQKLGTSSKMYRDLRDENKDLTDRGLSAVFDEYQLDALVIPTEAKGSRTPAAIAGWPMVSLVRMHLFDAPGVRSRLEPDFDEPPRCSALCL